MKRKIQPIQYGASWDLGQVIGIDKISITYTQSPDTNSDRDEDQYLTIETQIGGSLATLEDASKKDCFYYNISTKKWSIEKPEELKNIIEDFEKRIYINQEDLPDLIEKEKENEKHCPV